MAKHCIIILTSYEYESLQLTLKALTHTITEPDVPVYVILNGDTGFKGSKVEQICRKWAAETENRYVIRPLSSGKEPLFAIQEVVASELLKPYEYILKIDDDLIPLKGGWVTDLADLYHQKVQQSGSIGFITGLINNNSWGFKELVTLFDKWGEFKRFMNFPSKAGIKHEKVVPAGEIDPGVHGNIWQYPALAAWLHEWTSFNIPEFISRTEGLESQEIDLSLHYSIGCMYSHKSLWTNLIPQGDNFDELLIHEYCRDHKLRKFAVMKQPFLHLYYFKQRLANAYLFPGFMKNLAHYFGDQTFNDVIRITPEDRLVDIEEKLAFIKVFDRKFGKIEKVLTKLRNFLPFKI